MNEMGITFPLLFYIHVEMASNDIFHSSMKDRFLKILEYFIQRLANNFVLTRRGNSTNPTHYTKYGIIQAREEYRQNPPARLDNQGRGVVEGDFCSAISLYHAYELLLQHGMRTFYNFMLKTLGEQSDSPVASTSTLASEKSPAGSISLLNFKCSLEIFF